MWGREAEERDLFTLATPPELAVADVAAVVGKFWRGIARIFFTACSAAMIIGAEGLVATLPGKIEASTTCYWGLLVLLAAKGGGAGETYNIVSAVDLGVEINDRARSTAELGTIISPQPGRPKPVVGATALDVSVNVCLSGHTGWGLQHSDGGAVSIGPPLDGSEHVFDSRDDGGLVGAGKAVGLRADGHAKVALDNDAAAAGHSGAQVLRYGDEGVARLAEGAFGTRSPLDLAGDSIGANDLVIQNERDARGGVGEDSSTVVEVGILVGLRRVVVGSVEVVGLDVGVGDDEIGVGVVENVVAYRRENPLRLCDHRSTVGGGGLDDIEHVLWTDSGAEKDLGGSERAGGEDDPTSGLDLVDTSLAIGGSGVNLDTSGGCSAADNTANHCVGHKLEVGSLLCGPEVGSEGTATLTVGEHEWRMPEGSEFLIRRGVDVRKFSPSSLLDGRSKDGVDLLDVSLSVHRGGIIGGDTSNHARLRRRNIRCLPSSGEVVVPVAGRGNEEHASVNCSAAAKDTSSHAVNILAGNSAAVHPNLVAKTGDIEAGEVFGFGPFRGNC